MTHNREIQKTDAAAPGKTRSIRSAVPAVDIYENENEILVHADMPGVKKEDVRVDIENGTLSVSGVRRFDTQGGTVVEFSDLEYLRRFSIPKTIDTQGVNARLKDGVLELHLPKSEAARPRMIEIKAA